MALLEEGKPKRWDKRLTGGMPMHLKLSRLKADSGDIKVSVSVLRVDPRQKAIFSLSLCVCVCLSLGYDEIKRLPQLLHIVCLQMGKTKIFIKNPHTLFDLEDQRAVALFPVAVLLQSKARSYICRRRYVRFLAVVDRVGALARGYLARARYRRILYGCVKEAFSTDIRDIHFCYYIIYTDDLNVTPEL